MSLFAQTVLTLRIRFFPLVGCVAWLASALVLTLAPARAQADEVFTVIVKKQEEKKKTRWSLSEWLTTRDKMRMQDLWLKLHSPTPYEFYVGGEWRQMSTDDRGRLSAARAQLAGYAGAFGLGIERGWGDIPEWVGLVHARVFGLHAQSTHITLQGGLRSRETPATARQALFGVASSIYLTRYVGIEGLYRRYLGSTPNGSGLEFSGYRWEAGAFIDFSFARLTGTWFTEPDNRRAATGAITRVGQDGLNLGLKLFF